MPYYTLRQTDTPAIKNAPIEGLYDGNGSFNNLHLAGLIIVVPWFVKRMLPIVHYGGWKTYIFLLLLLGAPVAMGYWTVMSMYGKRKNEKVILPDRNIEEYITIHDPELKAKYHGREKIPMQVFHDAYFEGKVDFNGEWRVRDASRPLGAHDRHPRTLQVMFLKSWNADTTGPRWSSRSRCSNTCSSRSFPR